MMHSSSPLRRWSLALSLAVASVGVGCVFTPVQDQTACRIQNVIVPLIDQIHQTITSTPPASFGGLPLQLHLDSLALGARQRLQVAAITTGPRGRKNMLRSLKKLILLTRQSQRNATRGKMDWSVATTIFDLGNKAINGLRPLT